MCMFKKYGRAERVLLHRARTASALWQLVLVKHRAPSQDAPTLPAHRTPTFLFMVANKSQRAGLVVSLGTLDGCNYHQESPQICPRVALPVHHGKGAL